MGKKGKRDRQASMWVATADLPKSAGHPFYAQLNRVLDDAGFDTFVEAQCAQFYADGIGRPSLAPGRYFRLLLLGYFEGLDSERAIAWRAADSLSIRQFLDFALHEAPPDHSTLSRTRRLIDVETHQAVFHVGVAAAGGRAPGGGGTRLGSTRRRSKPTRQCGASCVGTRRGVRGVVDSARRSVGHRDAHAGRVGAVRSETEEEGVERGLDASARSRCEDHEDARP